MQASVVESLGRATATIALVGALGAAPVVPPAEIPADAPATQILARIAGRDAGIESYSVPVRIKVSVHKLFTFHIGLAGTQHYSRPDGIALDVRRIPAQGRKLFAEIGTPLTWQRQYDLRPVAANGRLDTQLEGVPKQPSDIVRMVVDVDGARDAPLHAQWWTRDGSTIDMHVVERAESGYELPAHTDADLTMKGTKIHAAIDYGSYAVNAAQIARNQTF